MVQIVLSPTDFERILDDYAGREVIHMPVVRTLSNITGQETLGNGTPVLIKCYIMRTGQNWDYDKAGFIEAGDAVALTRYTDGVSADDQLYAYGVRLTISNIDGDATTITVDTSTAHGLSVGDEVVIQDTTNYDGLYTVGGITDTDTFTIADTSHDFAAETSGNATKGFQKFRVKQYFEVPGVFDSTGGDTEIAYIACNLFLVE